MKLQSFDQNNDMEFMEFFLVLFCMFIDSVLWTLDSQSEIVDPEEGATDHRAKSRCLAFLLTVARVRTRTDTHVHI